MRKSMSLQRIKGMLLQEYYLTKRNVEVLIDLFYFSLVSVIVYGFVSVFLIGEVQSAAAHYILTGILLWEIVRVAQYTLSVGSLWNVWSRNLSNLFVSPLSVSEYLIAQMISGAVKAFIIFLMVSGVALYVFNFNIYQIGLLNLFLFFINLMLFSWSIGLLVLGLIFRYGTRIQAFAWSLIFLFQPLTANVFPLEVLPNPIQKIAYLLPPTYVFEAARNALTDPSVNWNMTFIALLQNIVYFLVASFAFQYMFRKSRESGQFAKNEG